MQSKKRAGLFLVISLLAVVLSTGCEEDEFANAPRTSAQAAGSASAGNAAGAEGAQVGEGQGGLGPVSGMELPPGHPPVGGESAGGNQAPAQGGVEAPQIPRVSPEQFGQVGPILWDAPSQWEPRAPSNDMRFAEYSVPGPAGAEPAEVTVFYFGPGGGGGVEANLERWASQLTGDRAAEFGERQVNDVKVYTVDAVGQYDAGMAMGGGAPKEDQRLLGAIAETDEGLFFFRLLGERGIVDAEKDGFDAFVESFRRGG